MKNLTRIIWMPVALLTIALTVGGCDENNNADKFDPTAFGIYKGTAPTRKIMGADMTGVWTVKFIRSDNGDLKCKCTLHLFDSVDGWNPPRSETADVQILSGEEAGKHQLKAAGTNLFTTVVFNEVSPDWNTFKEAFLFDSDNYEVPLKRIYPTETALADELNQDKDHKILAGLLEDGSWIGTNSSGQVLNFACGAPDFSKAGKITFDGLKITDANGKSVVDEIPAKLAYFQGMEGDELRKFLTPRLSIITDHASEDHFDFTLWYFDSPTATKPNAFFKVEGHLISTNSMLVKFSNDTFGEVLFSRKN